MNSDFTVVKYKKKKKHNKTLRHLTLNSLEDDCVKSVFEITRIIRSAESEISSSSYCATLLKTIDQQLFSINESKKQEINEILCYGLGNFSTNVNARYQLSLLLKIQDYFKSTVYIYDPVFSKFELQFLEKCNFNIIADNEKGKRKIYDKFTFVYLPHCPHWLVNNFLWKNWGAELANCVLFTNSFNEIIENNPLDKLKKKLKYLYKISESVLEINIDNSFKYSDIFNSLSVHIFPLSKIKNIINENQLPDLEEPFYSTDSEDISEEFKNKINIS